MSPPHRRRPSPAFQARLRPPLASRWRGEHAVCRFCALLAALYSLDVLVGFSFLPSVFPTPPSQLRRASLVSSAQASPVKAMFQFCLLLAHSTELLLPPNCAESSRYTFIFVAAGDINGSFDSPWPASSGEPLPLLVGSMDLSRCCSAYSTLACSFCPL